MMHFTNTNNPIDFPKVSTIDRLWGEALDRAVPDTYSTLTWTQVEKIKAVFAELIVAECLLRINGSKIRGESLDELIDRIEEDFGVAK